MTLAACGADALKPTQQGLAFGKTADAALTMDYYAGVGVGARPIALLIQGENGSEASAADLLTSAGYDVFSLHYRVAQEQANRTPVDDVERAIRYVRFHAREWNSNGRKIVLIGCSGGAYLSIMAGLMNASGVMGSDDAVDRESARVQAVVAVFGVRDFAGTAASDSMRALLTPLIQEKAQEAALADTYSSNYVDPSAPAFLLMQGESDASTQTAELQEALRKVGVRCDLLRIGNHTDGNVPDWQHQVADWLSKTLPDEGPIGAGLRRETHSARSSTEGSSLAARREGHRAATKAANASTAAAISMDSGS